jgi:hypothetical protein
MRASPAGDEEDRIALNEDVPEAPAGARRIGKYPHREIARRRCDKLMLQSAAVHIRVMEQSARFVGLDVHKDTIVVGIIDGATTMQSSPNQVLLRSRSLRLRGSPRPHQAIRPGATRPSNQSGIGQQERTG